MKVIDFFGLDHMGTTALTANGVTIAGTRLFSDVVWSRDFTGANLSRADVNGESFLRATLSLYSSSSAWARAKILFAQVQPDLVDTDTTVTMGVRQRINSITNSRPTNMTLGITYSDGSVLNIVSLADWNATTAGTSHYWELVMDRAGKKVKVVRDGVVIRTVDISPTLVPSGFWFGANGLAASATNGSTVIDSRDVYIAEVEEGDVTDRLGSQVIKRLPVSLVEAAWSVNVPTSNLVDSLNDAQPNLTVPPGIAAMTWVGVDESDPKGLVSFSTDGLASSDRVVAINMQVSALATAGASDLDTSVVLGSETQATKKLTFTQTFDYTREPLLSNFAKAVFLKQWPNGNGTKAEAGSYKLKLKASS